MMRRALQGVCLLGGLALVVRAEDAGNRAREIVRRVVERSQQNSKISLDYTYLQRQEVRELDSAGRVRKRTIETWDVTLLEGSPYRRLVGRNDRPLSPEEQKAEDDKRRASNQQRRSETQEQKARRLADWQRRRERQEQPVKELPDAFNFSLLGEEQIDGRPVYRIDAVPKPGYKPKSQLANFFPKVKLRLWIDKADFEAARVEMETLGTISFGGFLVRLSKGTRLTIEQTRVNDEVWLPKHVALTAEARILLLKGFNRDLDFTFSDYKKFQVDSHVVAMAARP